MRKPQSVGLNLAARCNATCSHCCVASSPRAEARLSVEQVDRIVDDLIAHPDVREVGITGGEPLLQAKRVLSLIKRVSAAGMKTNLTTNGFWAITPERAARMIGDLESAGLSHLTISYDNFHAPYVKPERIRNALDAASNSRIPTILNMCVSRSHDSLDILKELGDSALCVKVTRFPVQQCGTGLSIPDKDLIVKPLDKLKLRCPGFELIYHHDGKVYPCCSPPIFDTDMTLGDAGMLPHEEFIRKGEKNALLAVIRTRGIKWLLDRVREASPLAPVARMTEAVSVCDVCTTIMKDKDVLNKLRPTILEEARKAHVRP